MGVSIGSIGAQAKAAAIGITGVKKATTASAKAMNILKIAVAATGIGLLVIAFVSLITFMKRSQKGIDFLKVGMAGLSAVIDVVLDALSVFGEVMFDAFNNPKQALIDFGKAIKTFVLNRFEDILRGVKGVGTAFVLLFEGKFSEALEAAGDAALDLTTGLVPIAGLIKDNADAISEFNKELQEELRIATKLAELNIKLVRDSKLFEAQQAKTITTIKQLTIVTKNKLAADQDRLAAVKKINDLEISNAETLIKLKERELAGAFESLSANEKTLELTKEEIKFVEDLKNGRVSAADAIILARDNTLSSANAEDSLFNIIDKIVEIETVRQGLSDARAKVIKRTASITQDIANKQSKALLIEAQLQKEISKNVSQTTETRISALNKVAVLTVEAAKERRDANIINEQEFQATRLSEAEKAENAIAKLQSKDIKDRNREALEATKLIFEEENVLLQEQLINREITQQEFDNRQLLNKKAFLLDQLMLTQEGSLASFELQNKINELELSQQKEQNKKITDEERNTNALRSEIAAATSATISSILLDSNVSAADGLKSFGKIIGNTLLSLLEKQAIAAIATIGVGSAAQPDSIATFGATAAPRIAILTGIVKGAVGVARGLINKAQDGMILDGASHAQGGIPIRLAGGGMVEAEGGEAIMNRRSTAMFGGLLSQINQAGGGKKFQDGGLTPSFPQVSPSINNSASQLANMLGGISLNSTVSVEEIQRVTDRVEVIEQSGTL